MCHEKEDKQKVIMLDSGPGPDDKGFGLYFNCRWKLSEGLSS